MPARVDRTSKIERVLANVYISLFNDIQKDVDYPNNIYRVRQNYNSKVATATRKGIESVYRDGITYVGRKTGIDTYLTQTDLNNIVSLTNQNVESFWRKVEADAKRKRESDIVAVYIPDIKPKPMFDTDYFVASVATSVAYAALAIATRSKAQQVSDQLTTEVELQDVNTGLITTSTEGPRQRLIWTTAGDEKVCEDFEGGPGCADHDGTEWDIDDPDIEEPPLHENCRCFLSLEGEETGTEE